MRRIIYKTANLKQEEKIKEKLKEEAEALSLTINSQELFLEKLACKKIDKEKEFVQHCNLVDLQRVLLLDLQENIKKGREVLKNIQNKEKKAKKKYKEFSQDITIKEERINKRLFYLNMSYSNLLLKKEKVDTKFKITIKGEELKLAKLGILTEELKTGKSKLVKESGELKAIVDIEKERLLYLNSECECKIKVIDSINSKIESENKISEDIKSLIKKSKEQKILLDKEILGKKIVLEKTVNSIEKNKKELDELKLLTLQISKKEGSVKQLIIKAKKIYQQAGINLNV